MGIRVWMTALLMMAGLANADAMRPMQEVVGGGVGEVRSTTPLKVPVITWGGDIATVHANGDAANTAAGAVFARKGLQVQLFRQDVFAKQVEAYRRGETPFLRGTVGMIAAASELLASDPGTVPVVIHQLTWSTDGDALVVGSDVRTAKDLKGKTIAIQAYGPHVDYLFKVLTDAGLSVADVTLVWTADLTGTDQSPAAALRAGKAQAGFMITPDALALTSGGNVGTGAEDSVKGARILMSTKTADKVIADVYAVRKDFLKKNRSLVEAFVAGLFEAQTETQTLMKTGTGDTRAKLTRAGGKLLLDSEEASADIEGLFADCTLVGVKGNKDFLESSAYPRRLSVLVAEANKGLKGLGIIKNNITLDAADLAFGALANATGADTAKPKFNEAEVAKLVASRQQQQGLSEGELFSFEVFFKPNQNAFSADFYADNFDRVIDLASAYGGALVTVEGNADPMGYLKAKKENKPALVLNQIKQSAKNLSLSRAQQVRDAIISYAQTKGVSLDTSQFAVVGNGVAAPKTGICGTDPCAPKNEQEWLSNMRVEFRLIQVEAESNAFSPL